MIGRRTERWERRKSQRVPVDFWVREERDDFFFLYRCTNISETGIYLIGRKIDRFSIMSEKKSRFTLHLPSLKEKLTLPGRTVWQETNSMIAGIEHPGGSAIAFEFTPLKYLHGVRKLQRAQITDLGFSPNTFKPFE